MGTYSDAYREFWGRYSRVEQDRIRRELKRKGIKPLTPIELGHLKSLLREHGVDDWVSEVDPYLSYEENVEQIEQRFGSLPPEKESSLRSFARSVGEGFCDYVHELVEELMREEPDALKYIAELGYKDVDSFLKDVVKEGILPEYEIEEIKEAYGKKPPTEERERKPKKKIVLEGPKRVLFEKIKKELDYEDISLSESAEEIVKEAVDVYYDTGKPELVRELLKQVVPDGAEIADIVISVIDREKEKIPAVEKKPHEEKYHIESWYLLYAPHLPEKYQWEYQIRGQWNIKRFKTFEEAHDFIKKGEAKLYIHFLRGEGTATWEPVDIKKFVLKAGEKFEIPPERYELVQPVFLSESKKWRWRVDIWNKETNKSYSKDIFEDELLKLKEKAEKGKEEKIKIGAGWDTIVGYNVDFIKALFPDWKWDKKKGTLTAPNEKMVMHALFSEIAPELEPHKKEIFHILNNLRPIFEKLGYELVVERPEEGKRVFFERARKDIKRLYDILGLEFKEAMKERREIPKKEWVLKKIEQIKKRFEIEKERLRGSLIE